MDSKILGLGCLIESDNTVWDHYMRGKKKGRIGFCYLIAILYLSFALPLVSHALVSSRQNIWPDLREDMASFSDLSLKAYTGDPEAQFELGLAFWYQEDSEYQEAGRRLIQSAINKGFVTQELADAVIDYVGEMLALGQKASQGDAQAQFEFGITLLLSDNADHVAQGEAWIQKSVRQGYIKEGLAQNVVAGCKNFKELMKMASEGDPEAQVSAGIILLASESPEDVEAGEKWIRSALEQEHITEEEASRFIAEGKEILEMARKAGSGEPQALYDFGFFLLHANNPEKGLEFIKKAAEQKYVEAEYQLGSIYYDGKYVEQDYALAFEWLKKAAVESHPIALFELGVMYHKGQYVPVDEEQAFRLYLRSAEAGYGLAMANVGMRYVQGRGVRQDIPEGITWLERGVASHSSESMVWLGNLYREGTYVSADRQQAMKLYYQSAEFDDRVGMFYLGFMQEESNPSEAVAWYERACRLGDMTAAYNLSTLYGKGQGVEKNEQRALEYTRMAAEGGEPLAQYNLGYFYSNGERGLKVDKAEALKWYLRAAEQGDSKSMLKIADFYRLGDGLEKDEQQAISWYQRAAKLNNRKAYNWLGVLAESSDPTQAMAYFKKAFELGNPHGAYNLANYYYEGKIVPQDIHQAIKYYHFAAERGHALAQYFLGKIYLDLKGDTSYLIAYKWFKKSAEQGNARAQSALGYMFEVGLGVRRMYNDALFWYKKAAAQGDPYAIDAVNRIESRGKINPRNSKSPDLLGMARAKTMILDMQILEEAPDKIIIEVEYVFSGTGGREAFIGANVFNNRRIVMHTGYKPQAIMRGHHKAKIEISLYYEGAPQSFQSDQIVVDIYGEDRKSIVKKDFILIKEWKKVAQRFSSRSTGQDLNLSLV